MRIISRLFFLFIILTLAGCGHPTHTANGKLIVAASIVPLGDFAKHVGDNLVDVTVLVPPGANPHTYQLTPAQMNILSTASVLILNGVHMEYWAGKAIDAADNSKLIVVTTSNGLKIIESSEDTDHPGGNPHVWQNPIYAIHQVEAIRDAFIKADPIHKNEYNANAAKYIGQLRQLDREIRDEVKTFKSKSFIVFHPAWAYFAKEYGLTEAAAIEPSPGKEPSPSDIRNIVDIAKKLKARAIFAEPQSSPKAAQVVADELGVKVYYLDPLGTPPDYDYIDTMHKNMKQLSKALK